MLGSEKRLVPSTTSRQRTSSSSSSTNTNTRRRSPTDNSITKHVLDRHRHWIYSTKKKLHVKLWQQHSLREPLLSVFGFQSVLGLHQPQFCVCTGFPRLFAFCSPWFAPDSAVRVSQSCASTVLLVTNNCVPLMHHFRVSVSWVCFGIARVLMLCPSPCCASPDSRFSASFGFTFRCCASLWGARFCICPSGNFKVQTVKFYSDNSTTTLVRTHALLLSIVWTL
jgi:hypothetical protein